MSIDGLKHAEQTLRRQQRHYAADSVAEAIVRVQAVDQLGDIIEAASELARDEQDAHPIIGQILDILDGKTGDCNE